MSKQPNGTPGAASGLSRSERKKLRLLLDKAAQNGPKIAPASIEGRRAVDRKAAMIVAKRST